MSVQFTRSMQRESGQEAGRNPPWVIFDLDGTLVHLKRTDGDWAPCKARAVELGRRAGLDVGPGAESVGMFALYLAAVLQYGREGLLPAQLRSLLDEHEMILLGRSARVASGVARLKDLRAAGSRMAIVTSNGRKCLEAIFDRGMLERELFRATITRDDVTTIKPDPEPLRRAVQKLGRSGSRTQTVWFVGDTPSDEQCARAYNAGAIPPILFARIGEPLRGSATGSRFSDVGTFAEGILTGLGSS